MKTKLFARTSSKTAKATIRIFRQEMRRDKKLVIIYSLLIPCSYLLYTVLLPLFFSLIIQSLIVNPKDLSAPRNLVIASIVVSVLALFAQYYGYKLLFNHEEKMQTRLTSRAMHSLMAHSYQFFSNKKIGSLAGDLSGFTKAIMHMLDAVFLQASSIIVNFLASLIIIAFLSPILLVPLGLLTIFVLALSVRSFETRAPLRNERKKATSQLYGTVADILGNQILARVFAKEKKEIRTVVDARIGIERLASKEVDHIQREAMIRLSTLYTFQIITIVMSIWLFAEGTVSIAALIFAVTYLGRVTSSLFNLTPVIRTVEQAFLDAAPITDILLEPIEVTDAPDAKDLRATEGRIELRDVTFHYKDSASEAVFDRLSMTIRPGERIGLAGRSGGGKTTLTKLLLRFADTSTGEILIDGQDIARVTQTSLRESISYVPQEPFLFHRSLRDNIAYGRPEATDDEIMEACRKAHAMEFIEKLPHGLDTTVGERGVKLSGGQRQRIAIARAILKDAPILILDEATSALDSESEKLIQASLSELMEGRTAIVIAHRLSTIQKMDRIIVLDDGRIIEDGTHAGLLRRAGTYARLWAHQSGGFIEE